MPPHPRRRAASLSLVAAALALALPTTAAAEFRPPVTLSEGRVGQPADLVTTAAGGDGTLAVVSHAAAGWEVRFAPPGAPLGPAEALGGPADRLWGKAPDLAIDDAGNAIAVWISRNHDAVWAYRPAGGSFGPPQPFPEPLSTLDPPRVAFLDDGAAVVAWRSQETREIRVAQRPPGGASGFEEVASFGPGADESVWGAPLTLATGPDGRVALAWLGSPGPVLRVAVRAAGASGFGPQQTVAAPSGGSAFVVPGLPELAFRPDGGLDLAWVESGMESSWDGGALTVYSRAQIFAASRGPGGDDPWSAPVPLTEAGRVAGAQPFSNPALAVHPSGAATVAWASTDAAGQGAASWVGRAAGAAFTPLPPPDRIAAAPGQGWPGNRPALAALCDGSTLSVWPTADGVAAGLGRGSAAPTPLARFRGIPGGSSRTSLAVTPAGDRALVAWVSNTPMAVSLVQAAVLEDPAGGAAPPATPGADEDVRAPVLSQLRVSRTRVVRGRGTTLSWRASERGRVLVGIERRVGRSWSSVRRCVATLPAGTATLATVRGGVNRSVKAGAGTYGFPGKVGGRALAPGRYRFTVVAVDAQGNRSRARTVRFAVGGR